jgi:hypothetical protein
MLSVKMSGSWSWFSLCTSCHQNEQPYIPGQVLVRRVEPYQGDQVVRNLTSRLKKADDIITVEIQ